jgi:hypothetical protein
MPTGKYKMEGGYCIVGMIVIGVFFNLFIANSRWLPPEKRF